MHRHPTQLTRTNPLFPYPTLSRLYLPGPRLSSPCSTASTFGPGARPVRFATRKICVSTAMVGSPKAMLSTTLAVLRPTPGRRCSASRSRGTCPPYSSMSRSEEHTSELQSLMRISYAVFCLKKKKINKNLKTYKQQHNQQNKRTEKN